MEVMSRSVVCLPLLAVFFAGGSVGCAAPGSSDSAVPVSAMISDAAESDHHLLLAELALQDGAYGTAVREYVLAARFSDDPERASQATRIAYQHGFLRQALVAATYWRELRPEEKAARLSVAQLHLQLGNRKKTTREYNAIIDSEEQERGQLFLELTGIFMDSDGPWLASKVMEDLARPYPELAQAHYAVAALAMNASRFQLALAEAEIAVEQDSEWLAVATMLARAQIASGRIEQGLRYADDLVLDSRDDGVRLDYAFMLMSVGRDDDARLELMLLLEETGSAGALRALGFLEMDGGRFGDAAARFSRLLGTGEYTHDAFFYLGLIAERMEDYSRAMRAYARVNVGFSAIAAQARLAHLMNRLGDGEKALRHLVEFGAQNPGFRVDMMVARAELLGEMGQYPEALDLYREVLELRPADEGTGYSMAFMMESSGDLKSSIKLLRSFLRKRRTDPLALNALGYTLVANTDRLKEASRYINEAVRLAPANAAIIDSKGWLHFRTGEFELALEYLREAYSLDNDPEIAAHLGEVLWEMGEQTAAQKLWFQALAVNPDSDALTDTMDKFGQ